MPDTQTNVQSDRLWNALTACSLSASKDQMLPVLCTVQVTREGDKLTFVSTDRFRLTRVTVELDSTGDDFTALVSTVDAKRICTMLGKPKARDISLPVAVYIEDGCLVVFGSGSTVSAPLQEGSFPKTDQLITEATEPTQTFGVNPAYLIDLCKMPGRDRSEPVSLIFNGSLKPVRSEWGSDGIFYVSILMPVRLNR